MSEFLINRKNRLIIIISVAIVIVAILCIKFFFFNAQVYYATFPSLNGLQVHDPVLIENVKIGHVAKIDSLHDHYNNWIVKLKLSEEINIPEKSFAQIIEKENKGGKSIFQISLVPSGGYLKEGDTILVKSSPQKNDTILPVPDKMEFTNKDSMPQKREDGNNASTKKNSGVVYKVQITTSEQKIPLKAGQFKTIAGLSYYREKGLYKYIVGNSPTVSEAVDLCKLMQQKGFKDAFVVAFQGNKRISIKEASEQLKK